MFVCFNKSRSTNRAVICIQDMKFCALFYDLFFTKVRSLKDPNSKARLIPSQTLEERRQAFNQEKLQGMSVISIVFLVMKTPNTYMIISHSQFVD